MSDDVQRSDDGFTPLLEHAHGGAIDAPYRARLATFEGSAERLEHGWRWRGHLASDDVAELLASGVQGRGQQLVGPTGDAVVVWLGDVWFDAETGGVWCECVERPVSLGEPARPPADSSGRTR